MGTTIAWRKGAKLSKLAPDIVAFYREAMPYAAKIVEDRSTQGRLPDGQPTAPLSKRYQKRKQKRGKSGIRDWNNSKQMWAGKVGSISKRGGMRIAFTGGHPDKTGKKVQIKEKIRGGYRIRNKTNQYVANSSARVDRAGKRLPEGAPQVPYHAFMRIGKQNWVELHRMFERHMVKAFRRLPPLKG